MIQFDETIFQMDWSHHLVEAVASSATDERVVLYLQWDILQRGNLPLSPWWRQTFLQKKSSSTKRVGIWTIFKLSKRWRMTARSSTNKYPASWAVSALSIFKSIHFQLQIRKTQNLSVWVNFLPNPKKNNGFSNTWSLMGWCHGTSFPAQLRREALNLQNRSGVALAEHNTFSRWWFQIFLIFTTIWGRFPFWLIFFKGVETTKQFLWKEIL